MKTKGRYLLVMLLLWIAARAQQPAIENLVFEGAGIRGLACSGAIAELEQHGHLKNIKRIGGTSAGAITALLLCLGYTANETAQLITGTAFQKFNSGRFSVAGGVHRLRRYFGWYHGNRVAHWLDGLIAAKTGNAAITFAQLQAHSGKALYVTGTDLTAQRTVVFSHETFPHMRVRDAVRISMSVPLYFEAVFMKPDGSVVVHPTARDSLHVLIDGGVLANFPMKLFDSTRYTGDAGPNRFFVNRRTIGFRIDNGRQFETDSADLGLSPLPVATFKQYITAFYTLVLENLNRETLTRDDWRRTVSIPDNNIGPRVRRLSQAAASGLVNNGRTATNAFLNNYPN